MVQARYMVWHLNGGLNNYPFELQTIKVSNLTFSIIQMLTIQIPTVLTNLELLFRKFNCRRTCGSSLTTCCRCIGVDGGGISSLSWLSFNSSLIGEPFWVWFWVWFSFWSARPSFWSILRSVLLSSVSICSLFISFLVGSSSSPEESELLLKWKRKKTRVVNYVITAGHRGPVV